MELVCSVSISLPPFNSLIIRNEGHAPGEKVFHSLMFISLQLSVHSLIKVIHSATCWRGQSVWRFAFPSPFPLLFSHVVPRFGALIKALFPRDTFVIFASLLYLNDTIMCQLVEAFILFQSSNSSAIGEKKSSLC